MAALSMTIGDYRQFLLTVTKNGAAVDLTGIQSLELTLQQAGGKVLQTWSLSHGVAVQSPPTLGQALWTVLPADMTWATAEQTLLYTWSLVDALGFPTLNLENGTFQLLLPP